MRKVRRYLVTADTEDGQKRLHVAASTPRAARRMTRSFLEFVDHGGYARLDLEVVAVDGDPEYGDLGATPPGASTQIVGEINRW